MKNCSVCEMKYIVKSVSVLVENVVGQWIAYEDAVHTQITAPARALIYRYLELPGKLFFWFEVAVKIRQIWIVGR